MTFLIDDNVYYILRRRHRYRRPGFCCGLCIVVPCVLRLTLFVLSVWQSVPDRVHDGPLVPPHSPTGCV